MSNSEKVLSVAIPTYKRPALLDRCIESVFNSAKNLSIEVLVMDDSLGDGNNWVYDKYRALGKNIRIIANGKNLGIDANICACIENASTDYVWLIGEDDLMKLDGIDSILAVIRADPTVPFVFSNYSYITADQKKNFREKSIQTKSGKQTFKRFFENDLWSAGFIGACVIRKNDFLATNYRDFIGTYYAHVAGICLASLGKDISIQAEPMVGNRVGDASTFTWSEDSYGVFQGWRNLLLRLKEQFGNDSYLKAHQSHIEAHGYLSYKFLIAKKADGLLRPEDVQTLVSGETTAEEKRRIRMVAACIPRFACISLRKIYSSVRKLKLTNFTLH